MGYKNPEDKRSYDKKYREEHREHIRIYKQAYTEKNREKLDERRAAWRVANKDKVALSHQKWKEEHAEAYRAYRRAYAIQHAEKTRARAAAWYAANKEKALANGRARRAANLESYQNREAAYRAKHSAKITTRALAWQKANPDKRRVISQRSRVKRRNISVNDFSHAQWIEIQEIQNHRCYYCKKRRKGKLTIDHVVPLSKGGDHTQANIVAACQSCNSKKWANAAPVAVQLRLFMIAAPKKAKS